MKQYVVIDRYSGTTYEGFESWNEAVGFAWARFDALYNKPGLDYKDRIEDLLEFGVSMMTIEWEDFEIQVFEEEVA